tara:strand:- start:33 stop:590 length:558 start_codon:yes stop_codon:yes gene_type:complete
MYISSSKINNQNIVKRDSIKSDEKEGSTLDSKKEPINQIKNIAQEKKNKPEIQTDIKAEEKLLIESFEKLIEVCTNNKEMKLKFDLEKNVNLVSFERKRIEISFNDNIDKNFVKDLSLKLFEWTGQRWIITFSKTKGAQSVKEKEQNRKDELLEKSKNSDIYKTVLEKFPDANLIETIQKKNEEE